jgi:hypothetical protein
MEVGIGDIYRIALYGSKTREKGFLNRLSLPRSLSLGRKLTVGVLNAALHISRLTCAGVVVTARPRLRQKRNLFSVHFAGGRGFRLPLAAASCTGEVTELEVGSISIVAGPSGMPGRGGRGTSSTITLTVLLGCSAAGGA